MKINNKTQILVEIKPEKPKKYTIQIAEGILENIRAYLTENKKKLVIITDETVKDLYGLSLQNALINAGYDCVLLAFPSGEQSKNIHTKCALEAQMFAHHCGRDTCILALGGGVSGDMAGFIAATYMRGISYIQMPTTLLAMLDSSVGGKTGIDTPAGKNLCGAFWQPEAVLADIATLKTLPSEQVINGLFEAIKIFLTNDIESLAFVQRQQAAIINKDISVLAELVQRAVQLKVQIVARDEKEKGERMVLNFGHTIGHAIELVTDYQLLHGFAVAYGMLAEAKIACLLGYLSEKNLEKIEKIIESFGIHRKGLQSFDIEKILDATRLDKKKKGDAVRYILLKELGVVVVKNNNWAFEVDDEIVRKAFY